VQTIEIKAKGKYNSQPQELSEGSLDSTFEIAKKPFPESFTE
jgi:hypothetical protein